jgi:hypothetical protein
VARDYRRAAQIYEQRCRRGEGDLAACRELVFAALRHRGDAKIVGFDGAAVLQRACDHGDWQACAFRAVDFDRAKARAACDAGTPAACVAAVSADAFSQSGTVEDEDRQRLERACRADFVEACIDLTGPGRQALAPDLAEHLRRACKAGDADACAAAGTPISPAELCRAHDYEACAVAGKTDPAALERACDAGVPSACTDLAVRARDADPPDPTVVARFQRACRLGGVISGHDACLENKPGDLAIGCGAYMPARIPAAHRTHLPPLHGTDPSGAGWSATTKPFVLLLARASDPAQRVSPAAYGDLARRLAPDVATYVYARRGEDPAAYAPAAAVVLDLSLADQRIATGPATQPLMDGTLGHDVSIVVDGSGVPRAVLRFEDGLVPATLASCVRGLLAEP